MHVSQGSKIVEADSIELLIFVFMLALSMSSGILKDLTLMVSPLERIENDASHGKRGMLIVAFGMGLVKEGWARPVDSSVLRQKYHPSLDKLR